MCFQPYNRLCHWGPFTALGIIKIVTGMTIHCSSMWWPPHLSIGGFLNSATFMVLSGLTLYNFLSSVFHGPGYLPLKWKPVKEDDTIHLQWCTICEGYKAPRSHHCRKCGRCVLKMDHHCPWVNACVGWGNHGHFTAFLLSAVLGCSHAAFILACSLYRALNRVWYQYYGTGNEPIVYLNVYTMVLTVFALGLAVGVVLAVGMLLFFQVRAIVRNRTGVEDWIVEKANFRRQGTVEEFQFPYDLGLWRNIRQVVNFSCYPVGNGINWEVKEGCDEFSLTREQIAQKNEKRQRTKTYTVISPVSGSWFPLFSQGLFVCLHPPCTDEPRIRLEVGDTVHVTRWRKYWFFGEKVQPVQIDNKAGEGTSKLPKIRGWFPRRCVVELTNTTDSAKKLN